MKGFYIDEMKKFKISSFTQGERLLMCNTSTKYLCKTREIPIFGKGQNLNFGQKYEIYSLDLG